MTTEYVPGLEGIVAARTEVSMVDGANGRLVYRGYVLADLAEDMSFEEVAHLLWHGRLPTRAEVDALTLELAGWRTLTPAATATLEALPVGHRPDGRAQQRGPLRLPFPRSVFVRLGLMEQPAGAKQFEAATERLALFGIDSIQDGHVGTLQRSG